jgi:hypothetical protein
VGFLGEKSMKLSMILRAMALIFAAGSFGFVSSAKADSEAKDVITGIIGEAVAGAAEAAEADDGEADDAEDPRCEAWENRCEAGDQASCNMADANCEDDEEGGADN